MLFWEDAWTIVRWRIPIFKFHITYTSSCKYPISIDYLLNYIINKKQWFYVEFESSRTIVEIYETKFLPFMVFYSTNILNYLKCTPWRIHLICLSIVMLNVKLAYAQELSKINLPLNAFWILRAIVKFFKHVFKLKLFLLYISGRLLQNNLPH
jgi:hypothetical protein